MKNKKKQFVLTNDAKNCAIFHTFRIIICLTDRCQTQLKKPTHIQIRICTSTSILRIHHSSVLVLCELLIPTNHTENWLNFSLGFFSIVKLQNISIVLIKRDFEYLKFKPSTQKPE